MDEEENAILAEQDSVNADLRPEAVAADVAEAQAAAETEVVAQNNAAQIAEFRTTIEALQKEVLELKAANYDLLNSGMAGAVVDDTPAEETGEANPDSAETVDDLYSDEDGEKPDNEDDEDSAESVDDLYK